MRELQERAARALPAEHVEHLGEWWLRRTASSSWWMGTVLPHGDSDRDELTRRISAAEAFYAETGATPRFQISPGACAPDLDAVLAGRGYGRVGPMSLQAARTSAVRAQVATDTSSVRRTETPTPEWFDAWYAVHGEGHDPRGEWDMFDRVGEQSGFASVVADGRIVAVGRTVVDTGWAGVFNMATLPAARGRGAGRAILAALAEWADGRGAEGMYLQVEGDNAPAVRLYAKAGFAEVCAYHYRTAPEANGS